MKSPRYESCPPILPTSEHAWRNILEDLTGARQGKLTVVGFSEGLKARWVVKCECGFYEIRTTQAIKNPNNGNDCCSECHMKPAMPELAPPPEPIRRVHERGVCGKMSFKSEKAAKQAARARLRKGANCDRLRVYLCPVCHRFHMSSTFSHK